MLGGGDGSAAAPLLSISGKDTQGAGGGGVELLGVEVLLGSSSGRGYLKNVSGYEKNLGSSRFFS